MIEENKNETQAIKELALISKELIKQNKSRRRWRIFLTLILLSYIGFITYVNIEETDMLDVAIKKEKPFAAEVILSGVIEQDGAISADESLKLLSKAFKDSNSKGVILRLNSPGGSPVQANKIYKGINILKKQYNKKLYVVIDDICVSGCYFIAAVADEIYADKSSIVGSIGVIMSSFGAVDAMKKLGIERRLYVAGEYKGFLDPFSKEDEKIVKHIKKEILDKTHTNFIAAVKNGRKNKLVNNKDLFSGLIWLGDEGVKLGLIDGIGDANFVAIQKIGVKTRIEYKKEKTLLEELTTLTAESMANIIIKNLITDNINVR